VYRCLGQGFFLKVKFPRWILDPLRRGITPLLCEFLLMRFLRQDIEMIESEYAHYCQDPTRHYIEVNPAIIALQRLTEKEYACFTESPASKNITAKKMN
jgi:renierapurpurin 18,18'-hydroxylase